MACEEPTNSTNMCLVIFRRNSGYAVDSRVWEATSTAERYAALEMLQELPGSGRVTVGGDKGFDTADIVRESRAFG